MEPGGCLLYTRPGISEHGRTEAGNQIGCAVLNDTHNIHSEPTGDDLPYYHSECDLIYSDLSI